MIKLDVITGFLGAGKTTYIKGIIDSGVLSHEKIVILENEFGTVNIDSQLLEDSGIPVYEVTKGCICCTLQKDFVNTLSEIHNKIKPDRVLIEPSGIFMLESLKGLLEDPLLKPYYQLNSITTIVDTSLFDGRLLPMEGFIGNQIKFADYVVLSKVEKHKLNVENAMVFIGRYNDKAQIDSWLGDKQAPAFSFVDVTESHYYSNTGDSNHPNEYESHTLTISRPLSEKQLQELESKLCKQEFGVIIRLKGIVKVDDRYYEIQYSSDHFEKRPTNLQIETRLVFIGQHLDIMKINRWLVPNLQSIKIGGVISGGQRI